MFKKTKSKINAASEKAKEKVSTKVDEAKAKIDDKTEKSMNDFMAQMKLIKPAMDEAGFKLVDISITIAMTPAIFCEIESTNDDGCWNDDKIDQDKLDKIGKAVVWTLKQGDKARTKFNKGDAVRFKSYTFELSFPFPALTLSFEPKESAEDIEEAKDDK